MSTESIRLIRDGEKEGGGGLYTYHYTVTARMTPALRWAVMRAILMFHQLWGIKSQDSVHRPQLFKKKESRSGFKLRSLCLPASSLTTGPNRLTSSVSELSLFCSSLLKNQPTWLHPEELQSEACKYFFCIHIYRTTKWSLIFPHFLHLPHKHASSVWFPVKSAQNRPCVSRSG